MEVFIRADRLTGAETAGTIRLERNAFASCASYSVRHTTRPDIPIGHGTVLALKVNGSAVQMQKKAKK